MFAVGQVSIRREYLWTDLGLGRVKRVCCRAGVWKVTSGYEISILGVYGFGNGMCLGVREILSTFVQSFYVDMECVRLGMDVSEWLTFDWAVLCDVCMDGVVLEVSE